jgi:hypothetical protein
VVYFYGRKTQNRTRKNACGLEVVQFKNCNLILIFIL